MLTTALTFWDGLSIEWKAFVVLVAFMNLDVITGSIAASMNGVASSKVTWKGASKKALTALGVVVAVLFSVAVSNIPAMEGVPVGFGVVSVIGWYIWQELQSILENYARAGVTIPLLSPLVKRLAITNHGDNSIETVKAAQKEIDDARTQ